jgi:hypothetical protein
MRSKMQDAPSKTTDKIVSEVDSLAKNVLSNFFISKKSFKHKNYVLAKMSAQKAKDIISNKEEKLISSQNEHVKLFIEIHDQLVKLCIMLNNTPAYIEMSQDDIENVYATIDTLFKKMK